ncbi:2-phospho-L-lactate guanylyltransferase [Methanothermobacter sp. K4]|uniref:2-phospho-L-lactate guanylyltransferase n=1 Tax=Methanothermobacter sp. K4 TaxID=2913262 RepID=UPI001EDB6BCF|nr:2-phospho-L-lactate guanylyltransferase [Methanothermobacter sp. K4]MCG2828597.1 2-phospho-L-lactate guanylyltransferase [Methanothermobacter sp. K4]
MKTCAIIPVSRFAHAKTRLSPTLSPSEREGLLRAMLMDVSEALRRHVDRVLVISADADVLEYAYSLGVDILEEMGRKDLNGALEQAAEFCMPEFDRVMITPSDIPLIGKTDITELLHRASHFDVVIAPAKGGGTNTLIFRPGSMRLRFGDCSFFEHLSEAKGKGLSVSVYDSFYLSLDVNTAEDLGEIILHGEGTHAREYLRKLSFTVRPSRGSDRLEVSRSF